MAIVGDYGTIKTWALVMPGGVQCTDHDMPDMPQVPDLINNHSIRNNMLIQRFSNWASRPSLGLPNIFHNVIFP
jgi:hypothetical protein